LACGGLELKTVLDLGIQKPVNLLGDLGEMEDRAPLVLVACPICGHGQQKYFHRPSSLFDEYLYASGTSQTLREYFEELSKFLANDLNVEGIVLEIACNDGSFMDALRAREIDAVGIDPSRVMTERARTAGHRVVTDYWPTTSFSELDFDVVIAQNVIAHTPDPLRFLQEIGHVLKPGGVALLQTSQALMIENGEFDTVYHEHYSFFSERSMERLCARAQFLPPKFAFSKVHGISMLTLAFKDKEGEDRVERALSNLGLQTMISRAPQKKPKAHRAISDWEAFALSAFRRIREVKDFVERRKAEGAIVVAVGAAAKTITFLRSGEIRVDHLVDEAPDKIGRFVDGLDVTIESLASIKDLASPVLFVIGAWNYLEELRRKILEIRGPDGNEFLSYFPEFSVG
jgi:SAM-dependent methyltransferase